jgi:excisionase family DNA binding protein
MDKLLETLPEFCERHSLSRSAAYREIRDGRLRVTKVGRRTLIARIDAEAWLKTLQFGQQKLDS